MTDGPAQTPSPPRRTPAALALGILAGTLAAVSILPTVVPLTQRVGQAEDGASIVQAVAASRATGVIYDPHLPLDPFLHHTLDVDHIAVLDGHGVVRASSGEAPADLPAAELCPPGEAPGHVVVTTTGRWAIACRDVGAYQIVGIRRAANYEARRTGWLIVALSLMVGISAAFGVLQVLSPLSRVSAGLARIGEGERGVRVPRTGFRELDELIDRLNVLAKATEAREEGLRARVEVVQRIAKELAHEVRNPLQSLEFMAGVVAMEDDPEERARLASSIQEEVRTLEAVVRRLLRQDEGGLSQLLVRSPVHIGPLVEQIVLFRQPTAERSGVSLEIGQTSKGEVLVDRTLLMKAIENLIVNAVDFAPKGSGRVRVGVEKTADVLVITVEDNGPGVPDELGDTIYLPSVSHKPGGTGLGLALVESVVRGHGGWVRHSRSAALGGAAFEISIPLVESQEEALVENLGR